MAEEPGTPAAPVSDHRPVPRGVLPRRFQTWLMAGLALGILLDHSDHRPARADPNSGTVAAGACRSESGSAA